MEFGLKKVDSPLTLQDTCCLCIVSRIEEYSVATLTLLPYKLRLKLMRSLPAVDLEKLARVTAFGHDIESECIWKDMFTFFYPHMMPVTPEEGDDDDQGEGFYRTSLLREAADQALEPYSYNKDSSVPLWLSTACYNQEHMSSALENLLCLPHFDALSQHSQNSLSSTLRYYDYTVLCLQCRRVFPNRLLPKQISSPWKDYTLQRLAIAEVLHESFNYHPESIFYYYHSRCILEYHRSSLVIQNFLSGTKALSFGCYDTHYEYAEKDCIQKKIVDHNPQDMLSAIISNSVCCLEEVSIFANRYGPVSHFAEFTALQLKLMAPFFSESFNELETGQPVPNKHRNLRKLEVGGLMESANDNLTPLHCLAEIVKYQVQLDSLTVKGLYGKSLFTKSLIEVINSRFMFREICIDTKNSPILLSKETLNNLFTMLLVSSSARRIELSGVKLLEKEKSTDSVFISRESCSATSRNTELKALILRNVCIPSETTSALLETNPHHLQELRLENVVLSDTNCLTSFTTTSIVLINSLLLYDKDKYIDVGSFMKPFLNRNLEKICLRCVRQIGEPAQLTSFADTLKAQACYLTQLKDVAILDCRLARNETDVEPIIFLFSSLVMLTKYAEFDLNIKDLSLERNHCILLHEVWKKSWSSEMYKFRVLRIALQTTGRQMESDLKSKLKEMCHSFYILTASN